MTGLRFSAFRSAASRIRPAADIDVAVNDDHPTGFGIDGERVGIFHLSHVVLLLRRTVGMGVGSRATAPAGATSMLVTLR